MSTGTVWAVVALCAVTGLLIKGSGPAATGSSRPLPAPVVRVVTLLAPALLAALVVTAALADGDRLAVGADTLGVAAAGVLLLRGVSILPVVLTAAVVTALARLAGLS